MYRVASNRYDALPTVTHIDASFGRRNAKITSQVEYVLVSASAILPLFDHSVGPYCLPCVCEVPKHGKGQVQEGGQ